MALKRYIPLIIFILIPVLSCYAQDFKDLYHSAEIFHKNYFFSKSIPIYDTLLTKDIDSTFRANVHKSLVASENGKNMLQYAANVEPVSQQTTAFEHFFLKYPGFNNKEWVKTPQNLIGKESCATIYNYMHYPEGATTLVYSAPNENGAWNIHFIEKISDTTWSAPVPLNENITTIGNEVFPYLSADKKQLFFASNGHYGMGGYDLYCCTWDEELSDWGVPQNLGFPYSSVGNDYLYYNTPDGIFSIFASDRANKNASDITLYCVLFDANPLKQGVKEEDAHKISLLKSRTESSGENGKNTKKDDSEYARVSAKIRELQNTLKKENELLDQKREEYANLTDSIAKINLAEEITAKEMTNLGIESEINISLARLQEIELDFLSKGIIITKQEEEFMSETVDIKDYDFEYANNSLGQTPIINALEPQPEVDLNFKILPTAVMASLDDIPDGLIYQVQLCVLSKPASLKALKGMSPVFERKTATGKYSYTAGVFYKYQDVLKALYRIRKNGFPGALINAYLDGEYTLVKKAIVLEKENKNNVSFRVVISGYDTLPQEALNVIKSTTSKDLAKTTAGGVTEYIIGPFNKIEEADALKKALEAENIKGVRTENITKK